MHKILIIDDEKDICFLISEILSDEKYLTYSALNSNEAISHFNKYNPDLVILDVWLSNSKLDGSVDKFSISARSFQVFVIIIPFLYIILYYNKEWAGSQEILFLLVFSTVYSFQESISFNTLLVTSFVGPLNFFTGFLS